MSAKLMGLLYECDLPRPEFIVLQAMADHADHEGGGVRPSLALVAWKTGYSIRQVRRIVSQLVQHGGLVVVEARRNAPVLYRIDVAALPRKAPRAVPRETVVARSPCPPGQNVRPDIQMSAPPDIQMSYQSDIQVSAEPSLTIKNHTHRARDAQPGVGVSMSRKDRDERRQRFERVLGDLVVADGEMAARRWWRLARLNRNVADVDDAIELVRWSVERARADGRTVNYASDVADFARAWEPPEEEPQPIDPTEPWGINADAAPLPGSPVGAT